MSIFRENVSLSSSMCFVLCAKCFENLLDKYKGSGLKLNWMRLKGIQMKWMKLENSEGFKQKLTKFGQNIQRTISTFFVLVGIRKNR